MTTITILGGLLVWVLGMVILTYVRHRYGLRPNDEIADIAIIFWPIMPVVMVVMGIGLTIMGMLNYAEEAGKKARNKS